MNIWWNENSDTRFFLEVDVQYPESLQSYKLTRKTFTMTLPERMKIKKSKNLQLVIIVRTSPLF